MTNTSDDLYYSGHILVLTSAVAIIGSIVWANWAEIDQITRAQGQVIASSRNQVIQELDGEIVEEILVKKGWVIKQRQVWVRFNKSKTETEYLESRARAAALKAAIARLMAEAYGGQPKCPPDL